MKPCKNKETCPYATEESGLNNCLKEDVCKYYEEQED